MTLKEIAKMANVSPATVSLVLNNKSGVGQVKRREIIKLLQQYNYTVRRKVANEGGSINRQLLFLKYVKNGFSVEENSGFIASILDSIEAECRKLNYSLRIEVSHNNLEESLNNIDYSLLDGVFVLGTELDESTYHLLNNISIPYIVIDNRMPHFHCNTITMDNDEMIFSALSYLKTLGFNEVGYFKSSIKTQNFEDRTFAFYRYCQELDLYISKEHIFSLMPTTLGAFKDMNHYLQLRHTLPPCTIVDNDSIAIGAMKALSEYGYRIPEDISIIGFDDIHFSSINSPALTTMRVRKNLIGKLAVKSLDNSIQQIKFRNFKQFVGGDIVIRESTKNCQI